MKDLRINLRATSRPTKAQRMQFYQFALDAYIEGGPLANYGFCSLFDHVFGRILVMELSLPELYKYKPKNTFYDCYGDLTSDDSWYWFPRRQNEERIRILKEILENNKRTNIFTRILQLVRR